MCHPPPPILQLDDLVLSHIFEHLRLLDLCSIAATCIRFNDVTQHIVRRRYEEFDYINELYAIGIQTERLDLNLIAKIIGPQVKCLHINLSHLCKYASYFWDDVYDNNPVIDLAENITYTLNSVEAFDNFLELIPKYFTALIEIQIGYFAAVTHNVSASTKDTTATPEPWRSLLVYDTHITDAHLQNIYHHYPYRDVTIELPDLHKEDNREWSGLKGTFLQKITGIRSLTLRKCRRIKPQYFYDFCWANAETMQHFQCIDCDYLEENPVTFEQIGRCLRNLQSFRLTLECAEPNLMCLASLTKLKELHLCMVTDIEPLLCRLAAIDTLETLVLVDCLVEFSSIGDSVTFTKLTHLNVKGCSVDGPILARIGDMNESLSELHFNWTTGADLNDGLLALIESSVNLRILDMVCMDAMIATDYFRSICHVLGAGGKERTRLCLHLALDDDTYAQDMDGIRIEIDRIAKENCRLVEVYWQ